MSRVLCAVVVAGLLSACGGDSSPSVAPSPTPAPAPAPAPTPAPAPAPAPVPAPPPATVAAIAGTWYGRMTFTLQGQPNKCFDTRMIVQQADRAITGDWLVTGPPGNNIRGDITGTLAGVGDATTFSGTVTWRTEVGTGTGACTGRSTFTGPSAPPELRWSAPDVRFDTCSDPGFRDILWRMRTVPADAPCS